MVHVVIICKLHRKDKEGRSGGFFYNEHVHCEEGADLRFEIFILVEF